MNDDKYLRWLKTVKSYEELPEKQEAIVCDLDGTLALMEDRKPFDWHLVGQDKLNIPVYDLLLKYAATQTMPPAIILLSGRKDVCRPETEQWLDEWTVPYDHLYMRAADDDRKDGYTKYDLFNEHIRDNYNVLFMLDDRDQVVALWRTMGLACFQVNYGNF